MNEAQDEGFTLIELLVALAILSIALAVLFSAISGSLDRVRASRDETLASSLAQSLLTRAGTERVLRPGETGGVYSNGFRWQLVVRPYGNGDDAKAWHAQAFIVRAIVSWRDGALTRSQELTTLRLAAPAKPS